MIDQILEGIAITLHAEYSDAQNNIEPVEQDLRPPAFYTHCINLDQKDYIAGRFLHSMPFEIVYFTNGSDAEKFSVLTNLLVKLRKITLRNGDILAGSNLNGRIIDGDLHIFADYNVFMMVEPENVPKMTSIEINERIE